MSTPELKPETPMTDTQRIRVNMREWPNDMRELCRLDFARKLESALNAAREAIEKGVDALERSYDASEWPADGSSYQEITAKELRAAITQIDQTLSPQTTEKPNQP